MTDVLTAADREDQGGSARFARVQDVVGPLASADGVDALYLLGGATGAVAATPSGRRRELLVPANGSASFGTYFNAFPGAHWRRWAAADRVRLRIHVDGGATLTLRRTTHLGVEAASTTVALEAGRPQTVDTALPPDVGLVWFELTATDRDVRVVDAGWETTAEVRRAGGVVLGTPSTGRPRDVAETIRAVTGAPALLSRVRRFVLVDHADGAVLHHPDVQAASRGLGARMQGVVQPNLGGSGGFARVLAEALAVPGATFATLLDDDIRLEPAALLRSLELARRTTTPAIVGAQMLDLGAPTLLDAAAERVTRGDFWWGPEDSRLVRADLGTGIAVLPALHRAATADYGGWWTCQIPIDVVRRIGLPAPLFLKWDDAEYGLRAADAGIPTISVPGIAVWHESWRGKDDTRSWPAFFHARNRLVAALLHGGSAGGVVASSLLLGLKQLLAMQHFAAEARNAAVEAVLEGPEALFPSLTEARPRLLAAAAAAAELERHPVTGSDEVRTPRPTRLAPEHAPRGVRLVTWATVAVARHWLVRERPGGAERLSSDRATWWVLPWRDAVVVPSADGLALHRLRRDRSRFRRTMTTSIRLHARLLRRWPRLQGRYRAAVPSLTTPGAWQEAFGTRR